MIDELKRQLAELDKDLTPVLAHVKAAQDRRAGLVRAIEAQEAAAAATVKAAPAKPIPKPDDAKPDQAKTNKPPAKPERKG